MTHRNLGYAGFGHPLCALGLARRKHITAKRFGRARPTLPPSLDAETDDLFREEPEEFPGDQLHDAHEEIQQGEWEPLASRVQVSDNGSVVTTAAMVTVGRNYGLDACVLAGPPKAVTSPGTAAFPCDPDPEYVSADKTHQPHAWFAKLD